MGRNLYILAASLALFGLLSCGIAFTNIAHQPGSPGDASLWRTMGLVLFVVSLIAAHKARRTSIQWEETPQLARGEGSPLSCLKSR